MLLLRVVVGQVVLEQYDVTGCRLLLHEVECADAERGSDLEGLGGAPCTLSDEGVTYCQPQTRWVGGAGHEIGHSLGLPHPPGCDSGATICDTHAQRSLMWAGYANYPATYLIDSEKQYLLKSIFIR